MRKLILGPFIAVMLLFSMNGIVGAVSAVNTTTTPGAASPTATETSVCSSLVANPRLTSAVKQQVFAAYGITKSAQRQYVIDRLVPSELGGTNDLSNLWPELRTEAPTKNSAEASVRSAVCAKKVDLATAQHALAADWTTADQVVQAKIAADAQAISQYLEAQKKAEEQQKVQDYLNSLPPPTQATQPPQQGCPNGGYTNSVGNYVCSPYSSPSGPPAGATAQCRDGTYSFSQNRSGTCSGHGGVAQWL
ncbi:MAG: DUF3761 domain-containing protein [Acidimicrobiia bacterium]